MSHVFSPVSTRRSDGLVVSEYLVAGPASVPIHAHARASLSLLLHGGYRIEAAAGSLSVRAPMVAYFSPNVARRVRFDSGTNAFIWVDLPARWAARVGRLPPDACGFVPASSGRPEWLAHRILDEVRADDAASSLLIQGRVLELLGSFARLAAGGRATNPPWLARAVRAIDSHEGRMRLSRLAQLCRRHPAHLARAFRQHMGCSVGEYVRQSRVSRARCLLMASSLSLAEIAAECGFADQAHFSREFKRLAGTTPLRFRRGVR